MMTRTAEEILRDISEDGRVILNLLQAHDAKGRTLIQISDELKWSRLKVKYALHNLRLGKHVRISNEYGRWVLVNYDFTEQVISKRPAEAANYQRYLESEIERLKSEIKILKKGDLSNE